VKRQYTQGSYPQVNVLTDRILLDKMNNCNAGIENITLAPNGRFYICPAFYLENELDFVGDLPNGLAINNKRHYQITYAPLCRICDAYQCKRCVWLNRKTTLEVNTPSHEQCVVAHLERNASRELLTDLQLSGIYFTEKEIKEIDYLDPFEVQEKF
jgi:CXXX repeat peptide maturase